MREIKFRAWDKANKQMSRSLKLLDCAYEGFPRPITDDNGEYNTHSDLIWMEYTGLKDKNGKEVYEGDVVQFRDEIIEVVWDEQCAGFTADMNKYNYLGWDEATADHLGDFEVIGNIHENPELLNSKKQ